LIYPAYPGEYQRENRKDITDSDVAGNHRSRDEKNAAFQTQFDQICVTMVPQ